MSGAGAPAPGSPGAPSVGAATPQDRAARAQLAEAAGVPAPDPGRTWVARGPAGDLLGFLTERPPP
ncbi:MAG TPA: D-alanyl-D-alanine carboxypeptidase, partial [Candidatus Dormibacteraeota bacterium]|nr:D-alanyl-D-alanine carboxypeptidase [Candidatus Dormibacteraeota bacterium]